MKILLIFASLFLLSPLCVADLHMDVIGASNYINNEGAISIYYSNIYGPDTALGLPGNFFAWNPTAGGPCNPSLNANCRKASDVLTFTVSDTVPTAGRPIFWVVSTGTSGAPVVGASIFTYAQIFHFGYGQRSTKNRGSTNYSLTFSTICTALNVTGLGVDDYCNPPATEPLAPVTTQLYIIADANGNGIIDAGEDIQPFTFVVDSSIPRYSSAKENIGITQFKITPEDRSIHISSITPESSWPTGDNGTVGAQFLRFYYDYRNMGSTYDSKVFDTLDPLTYPQTKYFNIGVNPDGSLMMEYAGSVYSGAPYYFRAAIVDMAGNVGFLTTDDSIDHMAIPK